MIDYLRRSAEDSWDLLIVFEKSWKGPEINEANTLEN